MSVPLTPTATAEATILYAVYSAGAVVLAWAVLQLQAWNARQDRRFEEARALEEAEEE